MKRLIAAAALAATALTLGAANARAHAMPTAVEDLAGHYQGFFQSSATGETGPLTLDMTESRNRQLDGVLSSPVLQASLPFHVTVAASGVATAVSSGGDFVANLVEEEGIFYFFQHDDGKHKLVGGTTDIGTLTFIKSFPGDRPLQVPRRLADPNGILTLELSGQQGPDFQGTATFDGIAFPFVGSIGNPDWRALAVSPAGTLLITGVWHLVDNPAGAPQPHMDGTVTATFADGSVHTSYFELVPAV
jgi:hypothetical protein